MLLSAVHLVSVLQVEHSWRHFMDILGGVSICAHLLRASSTAAVPRGGKWSQEDRAVISECHSRTRLLSGSMTRGSRQGHWSRDQQPKGKLSPCGCREAAQVSREDLDVKGFLSTSRQLFKFMGVWGLLVLVLVWLSLSHPAFLSMIQRPTGLIS